MSFHVNVTPEMERLAGVCQENTVIPQDLYQKYDIKKGLRDVNGQGVRAGLTNISTIVSFEDKDGRKVPCPGRLYYRGIEIHELTNGFLSENRFGFEETAYLLLFGKLPTAQELEKFRQLIANQRSLPKNFVRDVIMKAPAHDMMNTLSRSVLTLYYYDKRADDISLSNVLRQCLNLIAVFPMLSVYGYHAWCHDKKGESLYIHYPQKKLSTAENILRMLRPDMEYTALEAHVLDLALVLHADHGGGNNSTFTTHVVTSSGTDTYSAIAAALGSLKGPKHGGANIKVMRMFEDLKKNVKDTDDEDAVADYLEKLLNKEAFDHKGLIYGMGHAVYSVSDPRAEILREYVGQLSEAKHRQKDFRLYQSVAKLAPRIIAKERKIYKGVSPNVDFYSGLVYSMLGLPVELYTPIFACARIVGWSAHRMEELINVDKIIRPAYLNVCPKQPYIPLEKRQAE